MTSNRTLLIGLAVMIACGVATAAIVHHRAARHVAAVVPVPADDDLRPSRTASRGPVDDSAPVVTSATPGGTTMPAADAPAEPAPPPPPEPRVKPKKQSKPAAAANAAAPAAPKMTKAEANAHPAVPDARLALSFVGIDPEAEGVWLSTINDPTVPAEARKDLIEDLNEDGFPDPKHITGDDLPLILSRLDLIEHVGLDAMDDTNAAAFAEAYKDLVNMLAKLSR